MRLPEEFLKEMKAIVPDYEKFIDSYDELPTKAFRVNTLKISDEKLLLSMGEHRAVPFAGHSYYLGTEKWGSHPFHHAGLMYIQEPSAMAAVGAYRFEAHLALDMCAAPGGKTLQLAGKAEHVVANEINPSRAAVLKGNVERMGCKNVAVTNHSPKELEKLGEIFDLVLVDAPCSGEGMFRKDHDAVREWSVQHSESCSVRQAAILESADKVLKCGGLLIYSTCTFSRRENEYVVEKFMDKYDYELVMPSDEVCKQTSFISDRRMRRFYPHTGEGEGQFFAAMVKRSGDERRLKPVKFSESREVTRFLTDTIGHGLDYCEHDGIFYVPALPYRLPLDKIVSGGPRIGRIEKVFKPDHCFFSTFGGEMFGFEPPEEMLMKYLHGEELEGDHIGYGAIKVLGAPLGGIRGVDGRYKNLYPKGLRI